MLTGDVRQLAARIGRRAEQMHVVPGPLPRARRWLAAVVESATRLRASQMIDVRRLMQGMSHDEHVAKADAYFANVGWGTMHARKPFADVGEAEQLLRSLFVLLPHLELHSGARVLDFGAGTCWSSLIWGYLGCEVIAADVSASALRFGEERVRADPIGRDLPITFLRYDGKRLDLPDAAVDRIVGIDTLHHVLDVSATVAELARILRPGGIAAFSEPGPFHSLSPQSQFEMSTHGVIENDIRIEEIERCAREAGFERMRVAWFSPEARLVDVHEFERLAQGRLGGRAAQSVVREIGAGLANVRIFFLYKPGNRMHTSYDQAGLIASLRAELHWDGERLRGTVDAKNIGRATWLPSGSGRGEVNVGLQLRDRDGSLKRDFAHVPLSEKPIGPGEAAHTDVDVPCPNGGTIIVDLVAEGVTWFSAGGSATVTIPLGLE